MPLGDPRFWAAPGGTQHHTDPGGLAQHTLEVVDLAVAAAERSTYKGVRHTLDHDALVLAAIWHDYGKVEDYVETAPGAWTTTDHHRRERHLVKSYAWFLMAVDRLKVSSPTTALVNHLILAHHGRLEYGSPVEPDCPEAWALHLADQLSVLALDGASSRRHDLVMV